MPSTREPITTTNLLAILQLSDSFFPTGSFTQSYGLETYVQAGLVHSGKSLTAYLTAYLLDVTATSDGAAMVLAYRAALRDDWQTIIELDRTLAAMKLARESREASVKTGNRMLRMAEDLFPQPGLEKFAELIQQDQSYGHHGVVFALVSRAAGLGEEEAALAFVYTTAAALVNNAVRMIPLGQKDGQRVLKELQPVLEEAVAISRGVALDELEASAPALEIRAMEHERLYSRLFMS